MISKDGYYYFILVYLLPVIVHLLIGLVSAFAENKSITEDREVELQNNYFQNKTPPLIFYLSLTIILAIYFFYIDGIKGLGLIYLIMGWAFSDGLYKLLKGYYPNLIAENYQIIFYLTLVLLAFNIYYYYINPDNLPAILII